MWVCSLYIFVHHRDLLYFLRFRQSYERFEKCVVGFNANGPDPEHSQCRRRDRTPEQRIVVLESCVKQK